MPATTTSYHGKLISSLIELCCM